jgi:catechol 2,3-dioxygenase-like lactoylglutathione lyase family enzyme
MSTAAAPIRFHLSLNVSDLPRAVEFVSRLLGVAPAKQRPDYAKFELDSPPLVLSLEPRSPREAGSLNHLGFRFPDSASLVDAQRRLEAAGILTQREDGVECCYARQSKFWVNDLDHRLWEFYTFESDLDHRGAGQPLEQMIGPDAQPAPSRDPRIWEHRMTDPFQLPDGPWDEIRLRGSFNVAVSDEDMQRRLRQVWSALRPGGKVHLHHLTSDEPLNGPEWQLTGRAASVRRIPVREELLRAVRSAGFCDAVLAKFGSTPCFQIAGVELRETIIEAWRPATESDVWITVVYRGPWNQIADDFGTVFTRGQRVTISDAQWQCLSSAGLADAFTRMSAPAAELVACGQNG